MTVLAGLTGPGAAAHDAAARQPGLDTLRALAIVLVFGYHYRVFVSPQPDLGLWGSVGWVGVDLFFVLSGYLIGQQLLGGLLRGERLSLPAFYARRALRTWPAFWVVLVAYTLWPAELGGRTPPPLWRFLTFTQNLGLQPGTAFSHAWSLCIEEQFYGVLPLVLLAALRLGRGLPQPRLWAWGAVAGVMAAAAAWRWVLWQQHGLEAGAGNAGYHPNIYYSTWCRADEFLPGLGLAMLQHGHPALWQRLQRHGRTLLLAGSVAVAAMLAALNRWYYLDGVGYGAAMTVLGYPLMAAAFALLLLAALSPGHGLHTWRVPGAAALARWSYAIYLTHKAVGALIKLHFGPWLAQAPVAMFWLDVVLSLAVGALLCWAVERPFMRLRQLWVPGNFHPQALAAHPAAAGGPLPQRRGVELSR